MSSIRIKKTNITKLPLDAIVNASNRELRPGGGVDAAIHQAAGPELTATCKKLGGCDTGQAKLTPGFNLPAQYVIHTAGPIWHGGANMEAQLLACCYRACFDICESNLIRTVAFPAISTGAYGYPLEQATKIALQETEKYRKESHNIQRVVFACLDEETFEMYKKISAAMAIEDVIIE